MRPLNMTVAPSSYHYSEDKIREEESQIRAAIKDPRAFAPLYEAYYLRIFRYVLQRVEDEDVAGDITSQVFAKAMTNLPKYQFRGVPFGAWLFRVAQNELNQLFRRNKVRRFVQLRTETVADIELSEEGEDWYDESQKEKLVEVLRKLKPHELELIEMRFFEGRAFREIAEILDLTENNAKVKTFRVVQKLRKLIAA